MADPRNNAHTLFIADLRVSELRLFRDQRCKVLTHHIAFEEAVECFFTDFEVRRNKSYRDRYRLWGRTFGGRQLKIIFQLKAGNVVRIITGWDV